MAIAPFTSLVEERWIPLKVWLQATEHGETMAERAFADQSSYPVKPLAVKF
jgi:hypothetical protein